jgi:peptide deformylase
MNVPMILPRVLGDDDPLLREVSVPVEEFGEDLAGLAATMTMTMRQWRGLGLSAVQIGTPLRLIVVEVEGELIAMANPVIVRSLDREAVMREGCLSVPPQRHRPVWRPAKCDVEWKNVMGAPQSRSFAGLIARVVQHEIDHLDGVLITDKAWAANS